MDRDQQILKNLDRIRQYKQAIREITEHLRRLGYGGLI